MPDRGRQSASRKRVPTSARKTVTTAPSVGGPSRLLFIDALRGFDMFWITGGDVLFRALAAWLGWAWLDHQMEHRPWEGFVFYDLIFPLFVFIVGTYFPIAVLAMPPQTATRVLTIVCVGAAAGIALKMLWPSAPRWIGVPLYLMLGYAAIAFARTILDGAGLTVVGLLVAGGVLYNIGAVLYGLRWPNPWPASFGYHEFFHAFTAAAATCHYVAIWLIVAGVAMS